MGTERISGTTGLLALIGSPVGHSGSPAMYNYSFDRLGLDYIYTAFDVREEDVPRALDAMRLFHMRGMNVTMPDKIAAAKNVDELSPAAALVGAVNTIVNEDGHLVGHMTDGTGFVLNLQDHGVDIRGKKMTIVGGGGAATAIEVQCALDGMREISIFNIRDRFFPRIEETAKRIMEKVPDCKVQVFDLGDRESFRQEIRDSDLLVNATILGMKPMDDKSVVEDADREAFHEGLVVADTVYNPLETKLLREAREAGLKTVGGKGMLLWQGVAAFHLFTGQEMPVEEVKEKFYQGA